MGFLNDVPNYKTLESNDYYMSEVPDCIWDKVEAYAIRASKNCELIVIVNCLNDLALIPPTRNWGDNYLIHDLTDSIREIRKQVDNGKFGLFMDVITFFVEICRVSDNEINEFLNEYEIGYTIYYEPMFGTAHWSIRENVDDLSEKIVSTKNEIVKTKKTEFLQAIEHLEQSKKQLENTDNERARKDAVRDCASALETIIKVCGQKNDIKDASKELRHENCWGKDEIVKDGDAIFNILHRLYPDLRHGSTKRSEMSLNEARYWVDRITTYIDYMIRQKDILGK